MIARLILWAAAVVAVQAQIQIKPLLELEPFGGGPQLSPDGRTLAVHLCPENKCGLYLHSRDTGTSRLVAGEDHAGGFPSDPRWSSDGRKISFARFYSHWVIRLFILQLDTGREHDLGPLCDSGTDTTWSPDGKWLVASSYVSNNGPQERSRCRPTLFSVETGKPVRHLAPSGSPAALSPDGRMLAYADANRLLLLRLTADYRPAGPPLGLCTEPRLIDNLLWSPDGSQIVFSWRANDPQARRVIIARPGRSEAIPSLPPRTRLSQLLPDDRAVAMQIQQDSVHWRAALEQPLKLVRSGNSGCDRRDPSCSPDGRHRVFVSERTGKNQIWISRADGSEATLLVKSIPLFSSLEYSGWISEMRWSPDGRWIVIVARPSEGNTDFRAALYLAPASGGPLRRLAPGADVLTDPVWAPDSQSLFAHQSWLINDRAHEGQESIVRISLADGKLTSRRVNGRPVFTPDGVELYAQRFHSRRLFRLAANGAVNELPEAPTVDTLYGWTARFAYFGVHIETNRTSLWRLDLATGNCTLQGVIPFTPANGYLSRDEQTLLLEQSPEPKRRAVLLEGLGTRR